MGRTQNKNEKPKSEHRVVKKCTECEREIPVACKTCPLCKSSVTPSKPNKDKDDDDKEATAKIRRTERVRRERPDFFNSMELENKFKKKRRRKESATSLVSSNSSKTSTEGESPNPDTTPKKRRGRPRSVNGVNSESVGPENKTPPPEEEYYLQVPQEKFLQYTVILAELNRKFALQNFKPL